MANMDPEKSDLIDVKELIRTRTVQEFGAAAEQYFKTLVDPLLLLAKPLIQVDDAASLLSQFSLLLRGLKPLPGMHVVDFGAGTCWMSRFLTQLGLKVTAIDVSTSALALGKELYHRQPILGNKPLPTFLPFNGHRIDLPDASVDRLFCIDAFHHIPNPKTVLAEMARILRHGGRAGLAEPGPSHSRSPQSQFEMRNYTVIENDIVLEDIWQAASHSGFTSISVAVYDPDPSRLSLTEFSRLLSGDGLSEKPGEALRARLKDHRVFFLQKGEPDPLDSRQTGGLACELAVSVATTKVRNGTLLPCELRVCNTGTASWLPGADTPGAVGLAVQLLNEPGTLVRDYFRQPLRESGRHIVPGEQLELGFQLPINIGAGISYLRFDLVAEHVTWFQNVGSMPVTVRIEVT